MQWSDVLQNPYLQNLPFKIELDEWGKTEMSPASNPRSITQVDIATEIRRRRGGKGLDKYSIQTTDGVRVADVAWVSNKLGMDGKRKIIKPSTT